jgi:hypothetical protein
MKEDTMKEDTMKEEQTDLKVTEHTQELTQGLTQEPTQEPTQELTQDSIQINLTPRSKREEYLLEEYKRKDPVQIDATAELEKISETEYMLRISSIKNDSKNLTKQETQHRDYPEEPRPVMFVLTKEDQVERYLAHTRYSCKGCIECQEIYYFAQRGISIESEEQSGQYCVLCAREQGQTIELRVVTDEKREQNRRRRQLKQSNWKTWTSSQRQWDARETREKAWN